MTTNQNNAYDADLLVVGLGPAGDVLAALARLQGVSVIAIDREPDVYFAPRAAVFDHEIMRIFQMVGAAPAIELACRVPERYEFVNAEGQLLLDFAIAPFVPTSGWAENYVLHQPMVERLLRQRLEELSVDVRLGHRFEHLEQDDDGVTCRIGSPDGDYSLRTRYVVGCDGASSPVRESLGIGLFDYRFDEPWLVIDAIVDDPGDLPVRTMQICDPRRPITYMKMCGNRFRWEFMIKPGEDPVEISKDDSIRALLAPWNCVDRLTIERRAIYRFHGLVAENWRKKRVLLAGDAAHQMPPFAGQGMCAGIRDAANLAWKIAAALKGEAAETVLDSYQREREPHVRAVIEIAIAMGRVVCLLNPEAAAGRDAAMLARKAAGETDIAMAFPDLSGGMLTDTPGAGGLFIQPIAGAVRLDDCLGPGAWLIGRDLPEATQRDMRLVDLDDPVIAPFAVAVQNWLRGHNAEAALIRPDRHVFGTGHAADLSRAWDAMLAGR